MADQEDKSSKTVTCKGPVNIAVIKYWGKRNEELILPLNSSLSVTLSQKELCTTTTAVASHSFSCDKVWINGKEQDIENNCRLKRCIKQVKQVAQDSSSDRRILDWPLHIWSVNNFPTAAGLASSAAGYACLVYTLARLYGLSDEVDLSTIARQGSGSACRSIYGGFVKWEMGSCQHGSDSKASQVASEFHWPEMKILILIVNDKRKSTSSTSGMQRSVNTSDLLKLRAKYIVPERMKTMEEAIRKKDFSTFAEITMKESNQLHAVCLDTYPPIEPPYLSPTSHKIIKLIEDYNSFHKQTKVAYTFDAGPNAVLFTLDKDLAGLCKLLEHVFPPDTSDRSWFSQSKANGTILPEAMLKCISVKPSPCEIKKMIQTEVGCGPYVVSDTEDNLLDDDDDFKSKVMKTS